MYILPQFTFDKCQKSQLYCIFLLIQVRCILYHRLPLTTIEKISIVESSYAIVEFVEAQTGSILYHGLPLITTEKSSIVESSHAIVESVPKLDPFSTTVYLW